MKVDGDYSCIRCDGSPDKTCLDHSASLLIPVK